MNYIVLDLEWNQCPDGKVKENKELPFEIIEIGAVKLDSNYNKIGEFSELIKPCVYNAIHYKTREVIKISMEELNKCCTFSQVCSHFLDWCGKDYIFATWGNMDLMELQRNMKYFGIEYQFDYPLKYYDVQKIFSMFFEAIKVRRTLEYAVSFLNISIDHEFHKAIYDAEYTGLILKLLDENYLLNNISVDYFNPPKEKKDEIYLKYNEYSKYISRQFNSKEEAMLDKEVISTKCNYCNKNVKRRIKWFSINAKVYYALCYCNEHGFIKCKIRMKKSESDKYFVIKTIKGISEEEGFQIQARRDELRKKRKIKRKSKKYNN
ncbi:exonuclease [Lachnotalea glycerini]|uniref:DNA polymerase III n=1 Tax=Lachnotalea glycerini TaxID=1763509 RepID=A0A255I236_9FIRM|nr:3'-5' exonuclease [Lachnotalea glycerini]PXV85323.1 exonuclease [Lachnotalea glycerini]RDY26202.1 DNA polymerase III [Lachnotalea glycerini]